jgi:hypothetical protein
MNIPSFLLAKLYVKGTLKNTADGFEFQLLNRIDSTSLSGIGPIAVGSASYDAEAVSLVVNDKTWKGAELSVSTPAPIPVGVPFRILVRGEKLGAGTQKIKVKATSADIGGLSFDIADTVA